MRRIAVVLALLAAGAARAEGYADLYGGTAYSARSDMVFVIGSQNGPADHTFHDVEWDRSSELGLRAGWWLDAAPWYGVGVDVFRFNANVPTQTVDTTILGVTEPATLQKIDVSVLGVGLDLLRLRYPLLADAEHAHGMLQPYFTAGPTLFRVTMTNKGNGELTTESASDTALGYKVAGGLSWQLTKNIGIFGEVRYTHLHAEPALRGTITGSGVPIKFDLNTRHLLAGASYQF